MQKNTNSQYVWHYWFAWYPVILLNSEVVWFETVKRKYIGIYGSAYEEYPVYTHKNDSSSQIGSK